MWPGSDGCSPQKVPQWRQQHVKASVFSFQMNHICAKCPSTSFEWIIFYQKTFISAWWIASDAMPSDELYIYIMMNWPVENSRNKHFPLELNIHIFCGIKALFQADSDVNRFWLNEKSRSITYIPGTHRNIHTDEWRIPKYQNSNKYNKITIMIISGKIYKTTHSHDWHLNTHNDHVNHFFLCQKLIEIFVNHQQASQQQPATNDQNNNHSVTRSDVSNSFKLCSINQLEFHKRGATMCQRKNVSHSIRSTPIRLNGTFVNEKQTYQRHNSNIEIIHNWQ